MIRETEFASCMNRVMERLDAFRRETGRAEYHPTFFELLFFMGMLWFSDRHAQAIVLETGMGGRLDANTCGEKACGLRYHLHRDGSHGISGRYEEKIAAEKAGIIKPGTPVVYWDEEPSVSRVIVEKAREMGAEAVPVSESDAASLHFQNKKIDFSMRSEYYEYIKVCLYTRRSISTGTPPWRSGRWSG